MELLRVENLCKYYPNKKALDGVSFTVNSGEIVALIGRNGAGKTTLMNSISSIIYPTSGAVYYKNSNLLNDNSYLQEFGILINATFFEYLSIYDNLRLLMIASGATDKHLMRQTIIETLRLVGLEGQIRKKVKSFSFGMKQRLGLAQTLLMPINFMILDEPFVGLDPSGKELLKNVIRSKARKENCGILFSSHDLNDVTEICDRIVMIDDGKKVYDDVFHEEKQYVIEVDVTDNPDILTKLFQDLDGTVKVTEGKFALKNKALLNEVQNRLSASGIPVLDMQVRENSLYDLFKEEES